MNGFELGVIILAAGASRRMGQPKLLLPWGDTTMLGHLLRQWQELSTEQIAVVHAAQDSKLLNELDRLNFPRADRISNPNPARGMFSSIDCAARWKGWNPDLTHWAIVLGDQPHVRLQTLRGLLKFTAAHPGKICQPAREGHARHPVLLPRPVFMKLQNSKAESLKEFLQARKKDIRLYKTDDSGLDMDLDTPSDYQEALKLLRVKI